MRPFSQEPGGDAGLPPDLMVGGCGDRRPGRERASLRLKQRVPGAQEHTPRSLIPRWVFFPPSWTQESQIGRAHV